MMDTAWMIEKVWSGTRVNRETMAMIEEDGICQATFARSPKKVLKVESYDFEKTYEEGKDYRIEGDKLVLTADSRIPYTTWDTFLLPDKETALKDQAESSSKFPYAPIETTDGRYITIFPIGNPGYVTKWQVAVTYETEEDWKGYTPEPSLQKLPRLAKKLAAKEPVTIVLYGDSISEGFDCSGKYNMPPYQPIWGEILIESLRSRYDSEIIFHNPSAAGMDSDWALSNLQERVNVHHPDLVILGWGMNDRCSGEEYAEKTLKLMEAVLSENPEAEFVLMASSLANELAHTEPYWFCGLQKDHGRSLEPLCKDGVVLADIGRMQTDLMQNKRYIDMTGNWLNHPNDYLARVQAQVVDAVLS